MRPVPETDVPGLRPGRRKARRPSASFVRLSNVGQDLDVAATDGSVPGPFADLPLREIFGAGTEDENALGLPALSAFNDRLQARQESRWTASDVRSPDPRWISTTLGAYDEGSDWVEIDISVRSWRTVSSRELSAGQRLWTLWLSLEVACWCVPDHNMHPLQELKFEAGSSDGLATARAAAISVVDGWMTDGLLPADQWRRRAGLPLRGHP